MLDLVESVKNNPIDDSRIERAKSLMHAARVHQMQKTEDIAGSLGDDFMNTGNPNFSNSYYRVVAVNAIGAGPNSNTASAFSW